MEAKIPLDPHGNPIADEEDGDLGGSVPLQEGLDEERQPLARSADAELNLDSAREEHRVGFRTTSEASFTDYRRLFPSSPQVPRHADGSETLFDVGSDDGEERTGHASEQKP